MTDIPLNDETTRRQQRLRLSRLGMAVATYAVVIVALAIVGEIGLGALSAAQWGAFVALAVAINLGFFGLLRSNLNLRFRDPSMTAAQIVVSSLWGLVPLYGLPHARPLVLMFFLPAFSFGILKLSRRQYLGVTAAILGAYGALLVAEYALGRREFRLDYELFVFCLFGLLLSWLALFGGFVSRLRHQLGEQKRSIERTRDELRLEIRARECVQAEKERLIADLPESLVEVRKLSGLLPICASCKKIRDDRGYWNQIEAFITTHSEAKFSHGLCPDCARRLYPDFVAKNDL